MFGYLRRAYENAFINRLINVIGTPEFFFSYSLSSLYKLCYIVLQVQLNHIHPINKNEGSYLLQS